MNEPSITPATPSDYAALLRLNDHTVPIAAGGSAHAGTPISSPVSAPIAYG